MSGICDTGNKMSIVRQVFVFLVTEYQAGRLSDCIKNWVEYYISGFLDNSY